MILLPWHQYGTYIGHNIYWRKNIIGGYVQQVYFSITSKWKSSIDTFEVCCITEQEAMDTVDAVLIDKGYTFISEERAESLRLLL